MNLVANANGDKYWFLDGKLHREDGPAIERANGNKYWYRNGKFHREDGPAIEYGCGDKYWYLNGKLHREDGPAVEWANGYESYWIDGEELTEAEFNNRKSRWAGIRKLLRRWKSQLSRMVQRWYK